VEPVEGLASQEDDGSQERCCWESIVGVLLHEHALVEHVDRRKHGHPRAGWSYQHGSGLECWGEADGEDQYEERVG